MTPRLWRTIVGNWRRQASWLVSYRTGGASCVTVSTRNRLHDHWVYVVGDTVTVNHAEQHGKATQNHVEVVIGGVRYIAAPPEQEEWHVLSRCQLEPDWVPGFFYSGVPGVLCHVEGKRIVASGRRRVPALRVRSSRRCGICATLGYIVWRPAQPIRRQALAKPVHAGVARITLGW